MRAEVKSMKNPRTVEWWRGTARHMWRTYFALKRQQECDNFPPPISDSDLKIFEVCDKIYCNNFVKVDQDILKMYFTSRWGDDLYEVGEYSKRNNIPENVIWIVINRANRVVMEELGLLEKKEENDDGKHG